MMAHFLERLSQPVERFDKQTIKVQNEWEWGNVGPGGALESDLARSWEDIQSQRFTTGNFVFPHGPA